MKFLIGAADGNPGNLEDTIQPPSGITVDQHVKLSRINLYKRSDQQKKKTLSR